MPRDAGENAIKLFPVSGEVLIRGIILYDSGKDVLLQMSTPAKLVWARPVI